MNSVDEAKRKNPRGQADEDTPTADGMLNIIEQKGREVAEAVAALRALLGSKGR